MSNNMIYALSYQHGRPWMDEEHRLLAERNGSDEGGRSLPFSLRRAGVLVAIALFALMGINTTIHASNPNGTFLLIGDVPLLGKSRHHRHHKKKHHKKEEEEDEPEVVNCDAVLEGVFKTHCKEDSGMSAGVFAVVGAEAGMVGIAAADDGTLSDYSLGSLANASNCERPASFRVAPGWESMEGVASYNVEADDDDALLWSLDSAFCLLSRLDGHNCRDALKDLTKDFEKELEGVNETTVDLELFTKDLC